ncbi:hypothetical protein [Halarsenatibacter silvermanii]|uniref:Peptidase family M23 n=1 Tax=Halarsenatibacter silvermanii TaxID=321763 RepID=A0A1G9Q128_9FIRM|nr:hypothetical protein [Halarsenatibacter silvermanii]SDM04696.1 hypothetical protein SAMN04488692_11511 [Halarsenatibacter silvermanii]
MPLSEKRKKHKAENTITIPAKVLYQYEQFSRYNSPYTSHERGCAIDLYPPDDTAPSPAAGEIIDIQTVQTPSKPYAEKEDYLIIIDTKKGDLDYNTGNGEPTIARIMHVEPAVSVGEKIEAGDTLGKTVRSGFFAPWVENHLHAGFRTRDANHLRASGSLPLEIEVDVNPVPWEGRGKVREAGKTFALLDLPVHPAPGEFFAGIADDSGNIPLDGGLPHFSSGGSFAQEDRSIELLGTEVGTLQGSLIKWKPIKVFASKKPIAGLSLFASLTDRLGARLICPDVSFKPGESVVVEIEQLNI